MIGLITKCYMQQYGKNNTINTKKEVNAPYHDIQVAVDVICSKRLVTLKNHSYLETSLVNSISH